MKMKFIHKLLIVLAFCSVFSACATQRVPKKEFIVDLDAPRVAIAEIEVQFEKLLAVAGLNKSKVAVFYYPTEDAVCLQYKYELFTYYQFWSSEGRDAFVNALSQYIEDYNERILARNGRKTLKNYGIEQGYIIWQLHRFAIKAKANTNYELGYFFKERFPYFTVNQRETLYIDPIGSDNNRDTQAVTMYFTRAQAIELATYFDQDYLSEHTSPDAVFESDNIDIDNYSEPGNEPINEPVKESYNR
ncbi:MAG: hypothetical protein LBQ82_08680 [Treponema sp.]|jgi:hypothetical protein|nr:hypothetical protein [Treponema sp.]